MAQELQKVNTKISISSFHYIEHSMDYHVDK